MDENYEVWKEYAYRVQIHPAILAYLELRREYFYRMETTVDGRAFATARGWEDLSHLLKAYEKLGKQADREVVHQYIQHWKIAKDFANYLELYRKYRKDYGFEKILEGVYSSRSLEQLKYASFDERLSVVNMLNGQLAGKFLEWTRTDRYVSLLYDYLKKYREIMDLPAVIKNAVEVYEKLRKAEQLTRQDDRIWNRTLETLEQYGKQTAAEHLEGEAAFARVKEWFQQEADLRQQVTEATLASLDHAFDFMEDAFGDSQEMVAFVAELNTNYYSVAFLKENDCDKYYRYNKKLLFDEQRQEILEELEELT